MEKLTFTLALIVSILLHLLPLMLVSTEEKQMQPKVFVTMGQKQTVAKASRKSSIQTLSGVKGESSSENSSEAEEATEGSLVQSNGIKDGVFIEVDYPVVSRRLGEEGTVKVSFRVLSDGTPHEVTITHSSGFIRLDEAAKEAVLKTKFDPASIQTTEIAIKFELNK